MIRRKALPAPRPLARFSPSTITNLESCLYRVALMRAGFAPRPSTFTALGNAAHELHELFWSGAFRGIGSTAIPGALIRAWDTVIERQHVGLTRAYAPSESPPPTEWPGYALTRARTLARLEEAARSARPHDADWAQRKAEDELGDPSTGLFGRVDRLEFTAGGIRVVDLKSGIQQGEATKRQRDQLLLYAWLVHTTYGTWPAEIVIELASGSTYSSAVGPAEAGEALARAVELVARFNDAAREGWAVIEQHAQPSPEACRGCSARVACEPYWAEMSSGWPGQGSARGSVLSMTDIGSAWAAVVETTSPSDRRGETTTIYQIPPPADTVVGERLAVVGADAHRGPSTLRWRWNSEGMAG